MRKKLNPHKEVSFVVMARHIAEGDYFVLHSDKLKVVSSETYASLLKHP